MQIKVDKIKKNIAVAIPLTEQAGKIRVKHRYIWYGYGLPVATRQQPFNNDCYIEWQIGYDADTGDKDKLKLSTLPDKTFIGSNGREKALYELSEYLYYFFEMDIVSEDEIEDLLKEIERVNDKELIENNEDLSVQRSYPTEYKLGNINFQKSTITYPLLLYKLSSFDLLVEIAIKEKQRAVGLQPMLYVCFPITRLHSEKELIGRCADKKEVALLILNEQHKDFIMQTFKIFALLSKAHKQDVISMINVILGKSPIK